MFFVVVIVVELSLSLFLFWLFLGVFLLLKDSFQYSQNKKKKKREVIPINDLQKLCLLFLHFFCFVFTIFQSLCTYFHFWDVSLFLFFDMSKIIVRWLQCVFFSLLHYILFIISRNLKSCDMKNEMFILRKNHSFIHSLGLTVDLLGFMSCLLYEWIKIEKKEDFQQFFSFIKFSFDESSLWQMFVQQICIAHWHEQIF